MNSRIMKYKFGPFWVKVRVTLTPVTQADGAGAAAAVLRLERPRICGGCVDLPIGRHGFPIVLLERSANDRRKLQFKIHYGAAGKFICLRSPTVEVYREWIAHLRRVFKVKKSRRARRHRKATASSDGPSDNSGSDTASSSGKADHQAPETTPSFPPASGPAYMAAYATQRAPVNTTDVAQDAKPNVFCVAREASGATSFTVFCPDRPAHLGHPHRPEMVFEVSSANWAEWLACDIRDGGCLPEVFRLTIEGCKRLRLSEILAITQPFYD